MTAGWPRHGPRRRRPCGRSGSGTTLSTMSSAAASRSPVRAALVVLAVLGALIGTSPAPAFAGPGFPAGETATRTFTYEVHTRGTVFADVNVFRRVAAATMNDRRG